MNSSDMSSKAVIGMSITALPEEMPFGVTSFTVRIGEDFYRVEARYEPPRLDEHGNSTGYNELVCKMYSLSHPQEGVF